MEHELSVWKFRPEKQDYLFRCSFAPGTTQVVFHLLSNRIFPNPFVNRKKKNSHYSRAYAKTNIILCCAQFFLGACLHERKINKVQRCFVYCRFTLWKSLEDPTKMIAFS